MAVDWIKMRMDLQTHPKVVRISSALKADNFRTIGGLHAAWSVFDAQSEDGKLPGLTPEAFDFLIRWPGFCKAMESVGWVIITLEGLEMPRFDYHNGKSAKRRAQEAIRKMSAREADKCPQEKRTQCGPEKRRVREDINTPKAPKGAKRVTSMPEELKAIIEKVRLVNGIPGPRFSPSKAIPLIQEIFALGVKPHELLEWWDFVCGPAKGAEPRHFPTFHVKAKPLDVKIWVDAKQSSPSGHPAGFVIPEHILRRNAEMEVIHKRDAEAEKARLSQVPVEA